MAQRTLAWSLAWLFTGVVIYASLYPFIGWRVSAGPWWAFVIAPWPRYWTVFDVVANALGYIPLGFFLMLGAVRAAWPVGARWAAALLWPCLLSFALESLQSLLPGRVSSNVDWGLNTLGGVLGAWLAHGLYRWGLLSTWSHIRHTWFTPDAHGALVLLGLWPWALLYPTPVPFGLGQISPLLRELWDWAWQGLPWWRATGGGHAAETWIQPLPGMAVATGVALGLLIPMGLGYLVLRHPAHRPWWLLAVLVGGVLLQMLSSLMTYGPAHFGAWWTSPVVGGVLSALLAGGVMHMLPRQVVWGGLMLMVLCLLVLLNAMAEPPYLHESLEIWAQGRFIRFHGATQWLGRLWPYAVLAHLLWRGWRYLRARHE